MWLSVCVHDMQWFYVCVRVCLSDNEYEYVWEKISTNSVAEFEFKKGSVVSQAKEIVDKY